MKNLRLFSVAVAISALVGAPASYAQDIKLGVIAGLSGPGTSYGIGIRQGAEMAVKEINADGGINGRKLTLVVADDGSNPGQSVTAVQRLVNEKVDLIVGGWGSSQVLAAMEPAERAGMPYVVVGASNPRSRRKRTSGLSGCCSPTTSRPAEVADVAVKRLGMKRIAVVHDANDYGVSNRERFRCTSETAGCSTGRGQVYQTTDKDFTSQLSQVRRQSRRACDLRNHPGRTGDHEPGAGDRHQGPVPRHRWHRQREPYHLGSEGIGGHHPCDNVPRRRGPGTQMGGSLREGILRWFPAGKAGAGRLGVPRD